MKKAVTMAVSALVFLSASLAWQPAVAEDVTVVGPVTLILMAPGGTSAVATLKDIRTGEEIKLTISDELTLDKFKDKRIVEGDEIRARFEKGGANTAKSFKKTAGC